MTIDSISRMRNVRTVRRQEGFNHIPTPHTFSKPQSRSDIFRFRLEEIEIASLGSRELITNYIYASTRLPCQDKRKPNGGAVRLGKSLAPVRKLKALQCQAYHCQVAFMHSRRYHFVHFPFRREDRQYATQDESSLGRTASCNRMAVLLSQILSNP